MLILEKRKNVLLLFSFLTLLFLMDVALFTKGFTELPTRTGARREIISFIFSPIAAIFFACVSIKYLLIPNVIKLDIPNDAVYVDGKKLVGSSKVTIEKKEAPEFKVMFITNGKTGQAHNKTYRLQQPDEDWVNVKLSNAELK